MQPAADPSRDLLFGLLALQVALIDQSQLVAAFQSWARDKTRPLADHLVSRGDLDAGDRGMVEALVARHLQKHDGDAQRSLAAIPAGRPAREGLSRVGDAGIEASLAHIGSAATQDDPDAEITASYSVGTVTSDGLRFRVLRPHAKGGLGAVFVALDLELNREVALKQILAEHADDPVSRQRFLLEAKVTGGLEHPGIVPVYGLGSDPDGCPYYAMRFVRGDSLKEAIEQFHGDESLKKDSGRRSLELRDLLRRFTDVCNAIEYAHSRGVLHRDIKPGNVIVGKHGETLVVDWGLAKPVGRSEPRAHAAERSLAPSSGGGSSSTLPGEALGTPAYMSPEQAEGDLERLGPRSDVYSLGATLYCLLTGKPPFEGDVAEVIRAVQKGGFRPPRSLDATIDRALEAVCQKSMALRPEDRYASARALAEDLDRWMADEAVSAWREPWTRVLLRWLARHRVGVTAAAAAVLVALAGTAAVLAVQTKANSELRSANLDLAIANAKLTQANASLAASNQRERARFALAQEAIRSFHTGVSEDVLLKQQEFKALRTKLLREAREFYRKLEGLLQGHDDRDSRRALGESYSEVGELTRQLDSIEEAEKVAGRALALFEDLCRENPSDVESRRALALGLKSLAIIAGSTGRHADALAAFGRSRDLLRALAEADPNNRQRRAEWAVSEKAYGMSLLSSDRPPTEAVDACERARSIFEAALTARAQSTDLQSQLAETYGALALALERADRLPEAIAAYDRARELGEAAFRAKPEDENTGHELARTLGNLGIRLTATGRFEDALRSYERAQQVLTAVAAANPTVLRIPAASAWIDTSAARVLDELGRFDEALAALERARAARETLVKANPSVTRNREQLTLVQRMIANIHTRAGRTPEVLATFERARDFAAALVDAHPEEKAYRHELAAICSDLADRYSEAAKPTDALSCFENAIAIWRKQLQAEPGAPATRRNLSRTLRHRGLALERVGRPADAEADIRQSIAVLREQKSLHAGDYYDIARAHSVLSGIARSPGSGLTAADGQAEADLAMASLRQAAAAGLRNPTWMGTDPQLSPIRSRPDFQMLLLDMAFPADVFAAPR